MRTHRVLLREGVDLQNQVRKTESEEGTSGGGKEAEVALEHAAEGASIKHCDAGISSSANAGGCRET